MLRRQTMPMLPLLSSTSCIAAGSSGTRQTHSSTRHSSSPRPRPPQPRSALAKRRQASTSIAATPAAIAGRTGCSTRRCTANAPPISPTRPCRRTGWSTAITTTCAVGNKEGRTASLFFDRATYLSQLSAEDLAEAEAEGPFIHYLRRLSQGGSLLRTTPYFDPEWYLQRYPDVADAIAARRWLCPLHHYLANDTPTEFDPLPLFSERYYLTRYPDIRKAVETGRHRNGYEHFLRSGARELRSPSESFDLHYYVTAHRSVRTDLESGRRAARLRALPDDRPRGWTCRAAAAGRRRDGRAGEDAVPDAGSQPAAAVRPPAARFHGHRQSRAFRWSWCCTTSSNSRCRR